MGKNKIKILVFANYDYLAVLENWMRFINKLGITNYTVVAIDKKLFNYLLDINVSTIYRPCVLDLDQLWVHRVKIIKEFVDDGYDIVHSDADAVWLKNPLELLVQQTSDLIFSQGTIWPPKVYESWGFVLCCGFFMIKSNVKSQNFINDWSKRVEVDMDDQVSLNMLLSEKKIAWECSIDSYILGFRNEEIKCFVSTLNGFTEDNLSVAMLANNEFQRIVDDSSNTYIKHLISDKNSDSIIDVLKQNDCFIG